MYISMHIQRTQVHAKYDMYTCAYLYVQVSVHIEVVPIVDTCMPDISIDIYITHRYMCVSMRIHTHN